MANYIPDLIMENYIPDTASGVWHMEISQPADIALALHQVKPNEPEEIWNNVQNYTITSTTNGISSVQTMELSSELVPWQTAEPVFAETDVLTLHTLENYSNHEIFTQLRSVPHNIHQNGVGREEEKFDTKNYSTDGPLLKIVQSSPAESQEIILQSTTDGIKDLGIAKITELATAHLHTKHESEKIKLQMQKSFEKKNDFEASPSASAKLIDQRVPSSGSGENSNSTNSFDCTLCSKSYTTLSSLQRHLFKAHESDEPYECLICGKTFRTPSIRHAHVKTDHADAGKKPYKCPTCRKCFASPHMFTSHLASHGHTHRDGKEKQGKTKTENGKTHSVIQNGELRIISKSKPSVPLPVAEVTLTLPLPSPLADADKLKQYSRIHTFENKNNGQVQTLKNGNADPDKDDKPKTNLEILKEEGRGEYKMEKSLTCPVCGKSFSHLGYLKQHKKNHSELKPFHCSTCGKSFGSVYVLKQHALIHIGEKPFKCSICGKAFIRSDKLKQHSYVHTGERRYKCDICERTFTQKGNRDKHAEKVHFAKGFLKLEEK